MNTNLLLVLTCLVLGFVLRKTSRFPETTPKVLNSFVIWISLPALVLQQLPRLIQHLELSWSLLLPVSMAWLLFAMSYFFFTWMAKRREWTNAETGALVLTAGLGNTAFIGLPLLEGILGPDAIPIALLVDQPGTFLVLSTLGLLYASANSPRQSAARMRASQMLKNVMTFPPFIAFLFAVVIGAVGMQYSAPLSGILEKLAGTLVPLAVTAVGFQLSFDLNLLRRNFRKVTFGLSFKLVLAPAIFTLLYVFVLGAHTFQAQVTILEAAMAPMITAGVVSEEFGFDPEISALMIGVGIPISLFTVSMWQTILAPLIV